MVTIPDPLLLTLSSLVIGDLDPKTISSKQWPTLIDLAFEHGLWSMLLWAVTRGGITTVRDPLWDPLLEASRITAMQYMLLENSHNLVDDALKHAEIPAVWLKGIALARTIYPNPALRPMVDLDLLVPFVQRKAALRILEELGYRIKTPTLTNDFLDLSHHYQLVGGKSDSVCLELHYRLLGTYRAKLLSEENLAWLIAQRYYVRNGTHEFLTLKPEMHLLYLCAHIILQHGEWEFYLARYLDLHLLIKSMLIDWKQVIDQAVTFKWTYGVERALSMTIMFFRTPIPDYVIPELQKKRPHDEDVKRAILLQHKSNNAEMIGLLLKGLPIRKWPQLFAMHLVPPQNFMRDRYSIRASDPIWPYYLYRWLNWFIQVIQAIANRFLGTRAVGKKAKDWR
jgi:hypothetical protein